MSASSLARNSIGPAAFASAATTLAVSALTKLDSGSGSAGINAVSHILWGDKAAKENGFSAKYTLVGGALNSTAVAGWAGVHEMLLEMTGTKRRPMPLLLTASLVSGLAYVTDYFVVPKRFTPGFEKRVTRTGMFVVYAALAAGLVVGALLTARKS